MSSIHWPLLLVLSINIAINHYCFVLPHGYGSRSVACACLCAPAQSVPLWHNTTPTAHLPLGSGLGDGHHVAGCAAQQESRLVEAHVAGPDDRRVVGDVHPAVQARVPTCVIILTVLRAQVSQGRWGEVRYHASCHGRLGHMMCRICNPAGKAGRGAGRLAQATGEGTVRVEGTGCHGEKEDVALSLLGAQGICWCARHWEQGFLLEERDGLWGCPNAAHGVRFQRSYLDEQASHGRSSCPPWVGTQGCAWIVLFACTLLS